MHVGWWVKWRVLGDKHETLAGLSKSAAVEVAAETNTGDSEVSAARIQGKSTECNLRIPKTAK